MSRRNLPFFIVLGLVAVGLGAEASDRAFFDIADLAPQVIPYESERQVRTLSRTYRVVYFFGAAWCDQCRASLASLRARRAEIPEDVRVVLVDFDNSAALRRKYAIPLQDVFVQIDPAGRRRALWVGGGIDNLKKNIKE